MRILKAPFILAVTLLLIACVTSASAATFYSDRTTWETQVSGITTFDFNALQGNFYSTLTLGDVTFDVPGYPDSSALWVSISGSYTPAIDIALVGNHSMTTIQGMFGIPTTALGVDVANLAVDDVIAINLDVDGTWTTYNISYTYPNAFFFGVVAAPGEVIDGITFSPTTSHWVGIDNFSYAGAAPTPEPASILLLGAGLAGMLSLVRRRY